MAEFIFKRMISERGREMDFEVSSMAVSAEELGNPVYPPARAELSRHGIGCDGKYAVQIKRSDYGKFDHIICMDDGNQRGLMRLFGGDPDGKIRKLLDFTNRGGDVRDPWFTGNFSETFSDVSDGCEAVYRFLEK
jgi:protein-tyrosine phosphatase